MAKSSVADILKRAVATERKAGSESWFDRLTDGDKKRFSQLRRQWKTMEFPPSMAALWRVLRDDADNKHLRLPSQSQFAEWLKGGE